MYLHEESSHFDKLKFCMLTALGCGAVLNNLSRMDTGKCSPRQFSAKSAILIA